MRHRTLLVLAVLLAHTDVAQGQIIRPVARYRPVAWTSLSAGWLQHSTMCDAEACWNFGGAPQFRGTLELPVGESAALGFAASTARAPLTYSGSCGTCDADANISQFLANFRMGGGLGFHQVIDVVAGTTMYSNFRHTDGTRLGTGKAVNDLTFGLGYGFGYGISGRAQLVIVQEWALVLHKRQPGSPDNTAQQQTIRIGGRVALGEKR